MLSMVNPKAMIGGSRKRVRVVNRGRNTDDDVMERPRKIVPKLLSEMHPKRTQDSKSCENVILQLGLQSFISKKNFRFCDEIFSDQKFIDLPISSFLIRKLSFMGCKLLTRIQKEIIPLLLSGSDVMVQSKTGTGKTLAYAIPIVHCLRESTPIISRSQGLHAIVIVPNRELALQVYQVFKQLTECCCWIVPGYLIGGENRKSEKARIRKGLNIIVATPGRLLDHFMHTECLHCNRLQWLVLDEADSLIHKGYVSELYSILKHLGKNKRQTVVISATLNEAVSELAGVCLNNPKYVDHVTLDKVSRHTLTPSQLQHYFTIIPAKLRLVAFIAIVQNTNQAEGKLIVFMSTRQEVKFYHGLFSSIMPNVQLMSLHGEMLQKERSLAYNQFCIAKTGSVLLCTDVASRGLDLPQVDWILQLSPPPKPSEYIHRVGRTARIGFGGKSLLFLLPHETGYVSILESKTIKMVQCNFDTLMCQQDQITKQEEYENNVNSSLALMSSARSAFLSYVRAYMAYPINMRSIFQRQHLHLGHIAKSFGLREVPTVISRKTKMAVHTKKKQRMHSIKKHIFTRKHMFEY